MRDWPHSKPELSRPQAGIVQCWRVPTDAVTGSIATHLQSLLDAAEHDRLDRFRSIEDRRRFLATHGGARILLGAALGSSPQGIPIVRRPHGKPALAAAMGEESIEFSLAHSGRVSLIALAYGTAVGVDVEEIRPFPDRDTIASRFFHPSEAAELAALSDPEKDLAFFRTWTRKEAVTKALGMGLGLELNAFRVSTVPDGTLEVTFLASGYPPTQSWSLLDIDPAPGHVGAIALALRPVEVVCRTLDLTDPTSSSQA